jgi:hypothetical protein
VAVLYHIEPSKVQDIYLNIGPDYVGVSAPWYLPPTPLHFLIM